MSDAEGASRAGSSRVVRFLTRFGELGNRLPDPVTLFLIMAGLVVVASAIFAGAEAKMELAGGEVETHRVKNLLTAEGIRWMFLHAIDNFVGFAPLGPVLTVMLGIGVAERSGFLPLGLRILVGSVPRNLITMVLVFAGVMSSLMVDAGYVVLTPLGALLFAGLGRHPIAGLAAAYAGVSGGFSANLVVTGLDPMLARLTDQAAKTLNADYEVFATANIYFMFVSVFLITLLGTWVTSRFVEPMLGEWDRSKASIDLDEQEQEITERERRSFWLAVGSALVVIVGIALLGALPASPLREEIEPGQPAVNMLSPFFESIEVLVTLLFLVPGIVYGFLTRTIRNDKDVAKLASDTMATMGPYLVLAFMAGQFVAYFEWTGLGAVTAVRGADLLESAQFEGFPLLLTFLLVSATMNFLVGSASAKWAFMAPIFVPMLMMLGFSPEAVQAAYRVGDSVTNIITPLMPYLPVIIVFAQRYDRDAGIGTIIAAMVPYSVAFLLGWIVLLGLWVGFDIPLGPGAPIGYDGPGG